MNFCSQVYIFKFTEVEIYCNKDRKPLEGCAGSGAGQKENKQRKYNILGFARVYLKCLCVSSLNYHGS